MKNRIDEKRTLAALAGAILALTFSAAHAQTYTWADNAQGQPYLVCPTPLGPSTNYYPSNSLWSQSMETNSNCNNTGTVVSQPSNWDPSPPLGVYPGGPGALGVSVIIGPPAVPGAPSNVVLNTQVTLDSLTLMTNMQLGIAGSSGVTASNYDFQGDGALLNVNTSGGNPAMYVEPGGMVVKSGGTGTYSIEVILVGTSNTFEVDSGTLVLPTGFGAANLDGGTFDVSNNAALLLTADSGGDPVLNGSFVGVGGGTVLITNGAPSSSGCDLNFPGDMLQWTGGSLKGGPWTNSGVLNISSNGSQFYGGCTLYNTNLVNLADNSSLSFFSPGGAQPGLINELGATFNIQGDSSLTSGHGAIDNYGLFIKSAGAGVSEISPIFNDYDATVEVDAGTLELNMSGAGFYTNATLVVSNGATLNLTTVNIGMYIAGTLTGSGGGTVVLSEGGISGESCTLDLPGNMFQWTGGVMAGTLTNEGVINLANSTGLSSAKFYNDNLMMLADNSAFDLGGTYGSTFYNEAGATFNIQGNSSFAGGQYSVGAFVNYGLFWKSAGTGTSLIIPNFDNYGGTVEVDSGTLALTGGSINSATFVVSNGATINLATNSSTLDIEGTLTGSGGGTILLNGGILDAGSPATLNFPGSLFQWDGGALVGGPYTNAGVLNLNGSPGVGGVNFYNENLMLLADNSTFDLGGTYGSTLYNEAGATFTIQGNSGFAGGGYGVGTIVNYGLFQKSAGTGSALITPNFDNYGGTVEVDSGTLALNNGFTMGSGSTFSTVLGGSTQFGQLAVSNSSATVAGTLNVHLVGGYAPPIGSQFQIISSVGRSGTFSILNVPQGISVTYSNTGVFLTVTGAVPVEISNPHLSNDNSSTSFAYSFGTASNQIYSIQQNTDLATTNWTDVTNFTGDGSMFQFTTPIANFPKLYFRVVESNQP